MWDDSRSIEASIHSPKGLLMRDIELVFFPDLVEHYCQSFPGSPDPPALEGACASDVRSSAAYKTYIRDNVIAIPTWQPAKNDLSTDLVESINTERRKLLHTFTMWALAMRKLLARDGYWLDGSCPQTGHALLGQRTAATYNELEGRA